MKLGEINLDPVDYASQGNAILGIRDSGKSYTATWLAERLLDAGIPFVAFDPIGVWRYLRVGENGNEGYPVVVAGGEGGDIPLTADNAANIVRAAMQENIPLVIDLYSMELSKADWRKIVEQSVRVLLYENKRYGLRHIFIEEAAEFVPQIVRADLGRVYAEIEKLARMGRNASLGYTLINQRPEEVNKAVLELCDCLFLHRQKGRHSLTALDKWMSIANTENGKMVVNSLPELEQGTCWVWLAGSNQPARVHIPKKKTAHPNPKNESDLQHAISTDVSQFVNRLQASLSKQKSEVPAKAEKKSERAVPVENVAYKDLEHELENTRRELNQSRIRESQLRSRLDAVKKFLEPQYATLKKIFEEFGTDDTTVIEDDRYQVWLDKLNGKNRDMLQILIQRRHVSKVQLALLVGMSAKGGSFNTYLSKLSSLKLVRREGEDIVLNDLD